jgi:hypothetical protein
MVRRKKVKKFHVRGADEYATFAGRVHNVRAIGRNEPPSVKQMEKVDALIEVLRERAEDDEQFLPILQAALAERTRLRRYPRASWTTALPKSKVPLLGASAPVGSGYRTSRITDARQEVLGGLPLSKRRG